MPRRRSARHLRFPCPSCGEPVERGAAACPHCGADEETGWSDEIEYDGLDLPEEGFGWAGRGEREERTKAGFWRVVTVVVLILLGVLILAGRW